MNLMLDLAMGMPSKVGSFVPIPAGPAAITDWSVVPGGQDGQMTLTIGTLPAAGDTTVAGNGLGTITALQWKPTGTADWVTLASAATGARTISLPLLPGDVTMIDVRALGYLGREGQVSTSTTKTVPGQAVHVIQLYAADTTTRLFNAAEKRLVVLVPDL